MSGDKYFLDTNVLVYSFDLHDPKKADIAEKLVTRALTSGHGVISYQVVQEFVNVGLRQSANPMTVAELEPYFFRALLPLMNLLLRSIASAGASNSVDQVSSTGTTHSSLRRHSRAAAKCSRAKISSTGSTLAIWWLKTPSVNQL